MPRMIFVNLPVKDLAAADRFYEAIGCTRNPQFSDDKATCMVWSDTIYFMLLSEGFFGSFTPRPVADARAATEVLTALALDDRAAVDASPLPAKRGRGAPMSAPRQTWAGCTSARSKTRTATSSKPSGWDMAAAAEANAAPPT